MQDHVLEVALRPAVLEALAAHVAEHLGEQLEGFLGAEAAAESLGISRRALYALVAGRGGRPLSHRNAAQRGFEAAAKEAGIEGVSMHSTRHAYASRMISRGVSATVLAKFLGHESASITERVYVSLFNRLDVDEAVRAAMSL